MASGDDARGFGNVPFREMTRAPLPYDVLDPSAHRALTRARGRLGIGTTFFPSMARRCRHAGYEAESTSFGSREK